MQIMHNIYAKLVSMMSPKCSIVENDDDNDSNILVSCTFTTTMWPRILESFSFVKVYIHCSIIVQQYNQYNDTMVCVNWSYNFVSYTFTTTMWPRILESFSFVKVYIHCCIIVQQYNQYNDTTAWVNWPHNFVSYTFTTTMWPRILESFSFVKVLGFKRTVYTVYFQIH